MVLRVLVALALLCGVAHGQGKPWADGVAQSDQDEALKLYGDANELFEKGNYLEALPVYKQALARWDHPAIHYNAAVCLINLDRTVEAYEAMQKAMAYGEPPLGKELFRAGNNYLKMLTKQVATLTVTLKTPGAVVKLDGKLLLDKPGTTTQNVLADEPHQLVAEKDPSYETETQTIKLEGGKTTTLVLEMKLKQRGTTVRRWQRWKPWAVVAASGAIAIVGGLALSTVPGMFREYDQFVTMNCVAGCPPGLEPAGMAEEKRQAAVSRQNLSYGIFVASGATLAAGLVLVVLNQPRLVGGTLTPAIGKESAGATLSWSW